MLAVLCAVIDVGRADDVDGTQSSDILEVMAWCKGVDDGVNWGQVLRLAKSHCNEDADDNDILRIKCSRAGIAATVDGARLVLEQSSPLGFACANGLVFLLAVALAYGRDALSSLEVSRAQVLLWQALQENFMLDASVWPVKTYDVLQLFDRLPPAIGFPAFKAAGLDAVTFLVPRCPRLLADEILKRFPGVRVVAGVPDDLEVPKGWVRSEQGWEHPIGALMGYGAAIRFPEARQLGGSG